MISFIEQHKGAKRGRTYLVHWEGHEDVTWEPGSNIDEQNPALVEYWATQVPTLLSSPLLYSLLTTHYSPLTTHYSLLTTQLVKKKAAKALKEAKAKNAMAKNAVTQEEDDPGAGVGTRGDPRRRETLSLTRALSHSRSLSLSLSLTPLSAHFTPLPSLTPLFLLSSQFPWRRAHQRKRS
jgi:hypothetical protein